MKGEVAVERLCLHSFKLLIQVGGKRMGKWREAEAHAVRVADIGPSYCVSLVNKSDGPSNIKP